MCLYPRIIRNPRYKANKKNDGLIIEKINDLRALYVSIGCGQCIECRKQKANSWMIRLIEEYKNTDQKSYFITLTFSNESFLMFKEKYDIDNLNEIATKAVRLFTERYRKIYKKALRHWIVTELGQNNTERLHLHGVLFTPFEIDDKWLRNLWQYGHSDVGDYCNERTMSYLVKYMLKIDIKHKDYQPKILCSQGIGKRFIDKNKRFYKFGDETKEYYNNGKGYKMALPIYYRNHFWNDEEREKLWMRRLDNDTRYVNKIRIRQFSKNRKQYFKVLREQQELNKSLGYGDISWKKREYKLDLKKLNIKF